MEGQQNTYSRGFKKVVESKGLVNSSRHRGFLVNSISIKDVAHTYNIKISLEGLAGGYAMPIVSDDQKKLKTIQRLRREMERCSKKMDVDGYTKKNLLFHISI